MIVVNNDRVLRGENGAIVYSLGNEGNGGKCVFCGEHATPNNAIKISTPKQKRGVWIHTSHNNSDVKGYCHDNDVRIGSPRKDGLQFGIELEVNKPYEEVCLEAIAYLTSAGFCATEDVTVGIEFKSPLYYSQSSIAKVASTIESLNYCNDYIDGRTFSTLVEETGCHLNLSTPFIRNNYIWIRRNKKKLFEALENYIIDMPAEERVNFFGRDFGGWSETCAYHEWCTDAHSSWINTELKTNNTFDDRLEFRLPKFINANQYITVLRVFSEVVLTFDKYKLATTGNDILNAFIEAYNEYMKLR